MKPMKFACFCGRSLRFIPSIRHGVSSDGRVLTAGHCSEHGWVGSDKKGPVVPVTPERERNAKAKK